MNKPVFGLIETVGMRLMEGTVSSSAHSFYNKVKRLLQLTNYFSRRLTGVWRASLYTDIHLQRTE